MSSSAPFAVRTRSETRAPDAGRPAWSESRTTYASPPPSDIGAGLRVTSAWGSPATTGGAALDGVSFAGGSTELGSATAFGGAASRGLEIPRGAVLTSRGRSSGFVGGTARGTARASAREEGVFVTCGAGTGRGISAICGAAGRGRLRNLCTGGESTSRTRIALTSPAAIDQRPSRAVRRRLSPRVRSSSRAAAFLSARRALDEVSGARGSFGRPCADAGGASVGTMANPSRASASSTSAWWRRSMGGWCVAVASPRRSMMISSSSPGRSVVLRAAIDAADNGRSGETMHRRLNATPDAVRVPPSVRPSGIRYFIRHQWRRWTIHSVAMGGLTTFFSLPP